MLESDKKSKKRSRTKSKKKSKQSIDEKAKYISSDSKMETALEDSVPLRHKQSTQAGMTESMKQVPKRTSSTKKRGGETHSPKKFKKRSKKKEKRNKKTTQDFLDIIKKLETEETEDQLFFFQPELDEDENSDTIPPFLPPKKSPHELTLVLDLDETLVHFQENEEGSQFLVRPYAQQFLNEVGKYYEVVIFTAALQDVRVGVYE